MTFVHRPRRLTLVCRVVAGCVVVVSAVLAWALGRTEGEAGFGPVDQVAFFLLGCCVAGAALLFTRARVEADADGVRVRNPVGDVRLPWGVVAAVRMDDGAPWAQLELHDDDTVAVLAVQSNDGEAAVEAVLELRRLLAASRR